MKQDSKPVNRFMMFLQFPPARILVGLLVIIIAVTIAQMGMDALPIDKTSLLHMFSVGFAVMLVSLVYYGFIRLVENRTVKEFSFRNAGREIAIGLIISTTIFFITIGIL